VKKDYHRRSRLCGEHRAASKTDKRRGKEHGSQGKKALQKYGGGEGAIIEKTPYRERDKTSPLPASEKRKGRGGPFKKREKNQRHGKRNGKSGPGSEKNGQTVQQGNESKALETLMRRGRSLQRGIQEGMSTNRDTLIKQKCPKN